MSRPRTAWGRRLDDPNGPWHVLSDKGATGIDPVFTMCDTSLGDAWWDGIEVTTSSAGPEPEERCEVCVSLVLVRDHSE